MTTEERFLIQTVRASILNERAVLDDSLDWDLFVRLSESHGLGAMVYDGLKKSGIELPQKAEERLNKALMWAMMRDVQMDRARQQLQAALTAAEIPHIFLKGSVLKYNYPIPALRTMSDMDVLVYAGDFEKIMAVAETLDGQYIEGDGNHRNYVFPGHVKVEFHPNLLHHATPVARQVNPGWQYVAESSHPFARELTEEGFYLSILCHLAEHFVDGGIGVRFVLDIWVHKHLRKLPMDEAYVTSELKKLGLLDFARNIDELAEVWFGDAPATPLTRELGEYILTSGSHGNTDRAILNALSLSPGGSRASVLWRKIFYPRAELEDRYPWCKGKAWLLPAAWIARVIRALTTHSSHIQKWSKGTGQIDRAQVSENREKLRRFGIR